MPAMQSKLQSREAGKKEEWWGEKWMKCALDMREMIELGGSTGK